MVRRMRKGKMGEEYVNILSLFLCNIKRMGVCLLEWKKLSFRMHLEGPCNVGRDLWMQAQRILVGSWTENRPLT